MVIRIPNVQGSKHGVGGMVVHPKTGILTSSTAQGGGGSFKKETYRRGWLL